jgi:hypothetical protein
MTDTPTPRLQAARAAQTRFAEQARRMTLAGGVSLADVRALATTDEEPFLLMPERRIDRSARPITEDE